MANPDLLWVLWGPRYQKIDLFIFVKRNFYVPRSYGRQFLSKNMGGGGGGAGGRVSRVHHHHHHHHHHGVMYHSVERHYFNNLM